MVIKKVTFGGLWLDVLIATSKRRDNGMGMNILPCNHGNKPLKMTSCKLLLIRSWFELSFTCKEFAINFMFPILAQDKN